MCGFLIVMLGGVWDHMTHQGQELADMYQGDEGIDAMGGDEVFIWYLRQ